LDNGTETAEYWIERPYKSADTNVIVDTYLGVNRGDDDDDTTGKDDDSVDDDGDDDGASKASGPDTYRYTIIATGKVKRDGTVVAKKQIKVKASIIPLDKHVIDYGVYTEGIIDGDGTSKDPEFHISGSGGTTSYADGDNMNTNSESSTVYRTVPVLDSYMFKALSTSQGHNQSGTWNVTDGYPNSNYYYAGAMPNVTYVDGNLSASGSEHIWGVFYVTGWVDLSTAKVDGIIICNGDITLDGDGNSKDEQIDGDIIQYGITSRLTGNGPDHASINANHGYFDAWNITKSDITIESWHETRSKN
jgi:hypothetical protein